MQLAQFTLPTALACAACLLAHALQANAHAVAEEIATPQFTQPMANAPGKSFTTVIVDFPPGSRAHPHRHGQAFVYAYVLKGAVRSGLNDEAPQVYQTGGHWFEAPGARHPMTENASRTRPARLLVVFVANTGDALRTPDQP
jgi:quercetin dioxygenase-like cupin family protein